MSSDTLRRFMLERAHVRGEWIHLDQTWQEMLGRTTYPQFVKNVLGEALTAAVLLTATIKHNGSLTLQIRGDGPIHLLVIQATAQGAVRGLARWSREADAATLPALFGEAQMAITLESQHNNERYQSLIPLEGASLSQALEAYFARSEQLPTRLWLMSDASTAAGILLQRLPQEQTTMEDWERTSILLDTLTNAELAHLEPEEVLFRLFHEEDVRLFDGKDIHFHCGCNREKVDNMLRSLGQAEAEAVLEEQGKIEIICEFCNASYTLDAVDVGQLFRPSMPGSDTLH
ncbi:Hsp33 family molecular chaperone HslO [Candidatus Thiothrix sp. Deng01]|uniref:33 kDa chaperonin n=1 Tax=Candidatus Thiothrix phosphatis TaxID=3112415 RepID=A0ABU6CZF3_9GAMM|nr:Hsp33 family molecular chaperone HslO [Candidatus Thiothrix sp. Deng01]MEB4592215.1 Hsp33 family molecular chaperone HslO [Candidatus Thiothrix sp. Deng01]